MQLQNTGICNQNRIMLQPGNLGVAQIFQSPDGNIILNNTGNSICADGRQQLQLQGGKIYIQQAHTQQGNIIANVSFCNFIYAT